jgi:ABC-2 type transport system permease protein
MNSREIQMLRNVYLKTLRDAKRSIIYYTIGSIALGLYVTLFYPTIRDATGLTDFLEQLPEAMQALVGDAETYTTAEGFLNAEVFSFMGPMVFGFFAIIAGMGVITGEEESHTLDQLLANPISRTSILIQKAGAMMTSVLALSVGLWIGLAGGSMLAGFDLSVTGTTQAILSLYLLGITLGFIALAVGAATGRKGLTGGIAATIGVVGFLLDTFLSVVDLLDPARFISVFYYFNSNNVMLNGINFVHFLTLISISAGAIVLSAWRFERRDLAS